MRIIPTLVHGALDYVVGAALILAPWIFGFADAGGPAVWVPWIVGGASILMALLTRFELGVFRTIPMRAHLGVDYVAGVFLAASPWIFGFADRPANVWVPHLIVGLAILGVSLMTQYEPRTVGALGRADAPVIGAGTGARPVGAPGAPRPAHR